METYRFDWAYESVFRVDDNGTGHFLCSFLQAGIKQHHSEKKAIRLVELYEDNCFTQ